MNEFEDQIFGEECEITDAPLEIKINTPNQNNTEQECQKSQNMEQNVKNCCGESNKKNRVVKRQISFDRDIGFNQKSIAVRSISTTQDNSQCFDYENSLIYKNKSHQNHLKELKPQNMMMCPMCQGQKGIDFCFACKGQGNVTGADNFPKFFEYLMEFKMGLKGSYQNRKTRQLHKAAVNQFCGDFYQSQKLPTQNRKTIGARVSISSLQKSSFNFQNYKEKIQQKIDVHDGFQCDQCEEDPIRGSRFHCSHPECGGDFDLCGKCYERKGHYHQMQEIKKGDKLGEKLEILGKVLCKNGKKGMLGIPKVGGRIFHSSIH